MGGGPQAKESTSRTKRPFLREVARVFLLTVLVPVILACIVVVLHFSVSHLMLPFVGRLPFGARLALMSPDAFKVNNQNLVKPQTDKPTEITPQVPAGKDPTTGNSGTDIIARCKDLQKATHLICDEASCNNTGKKLESAPAITSCSPQDCEGSIPKAVGARLLRPASLLRRYRPSPMTSPSMV